MSSPLNYFKQFIVYENTDYFAKGSSSDCSSQKEKIKYKEKQVWGFIIQEIWERLNPVFERSSKSP